jgi:glycosyltransferase involved in cell wall biosynthesis
MTRMGRYWNSIVAVSDRIAMEARQTTPELAQRLVTIRNGVSVPSASNVARHAGDAGLRIVYAGRVIQYQKRVLDLPEVVRRLVDRGVHAHMTIVGNGPDEGALRNACCKRGVEGIVRFSGGLSHEATLKVFAESDVIILTSDFEGLPMTLLEAMAHGCVPVVTDIPSGIPELVEDGVSGYRVAPGDIAAFAARIGGLAVDSELVARMSASAQQAITRGGYTAERMVSEYMVLFEKAWEDTKAGRWRRPLGPIEVAPWLHKQYAQEKLWNRLRVKVRSVLCPAVSE